mmetsp:Transcript_33316/g.102357  ORF Transcript_33316/g.102357 Transcript_33316/m.102357 type:complete len:253 (-) Transcript_33316:142-900(-)
MREGLAPRAAQTRQLGPRRDPALGSRRAGVVRRRGGPRAALPRRGAPRGLRRLLDRLQAASGRAREAEGDAARHGTRQPAPPRFDERPPRRVTRGADAVGAGPRRVRVDPDAAGQGGPAGARVVRRQGGRDGDRRAQVPHDDRGGRPRASPRHGASGGRRAAGLLLGLLRGRRPAVRERAGALPLHRVVPPRRGPRRGALPGARGLLAGPAVVRGAAAVALGREPDVRAGPRPRADVRRRVGRLALPLVDHH